MKPDEAIKILKNMKWSITTKFNAVNSSTKALDMAISALEKQSRIITVTDAEGGLLASISDKDIIEENGVHVIISEEEK